MTLLSNLRVGARLLISNLAMISLMAVIGAVGIVSMDRLNTMADEMYDYDVLGMSHIKDANINLIYVGRARGAMLAASTDEERSAQRDTMAKAIQQFEAYLAKAKPLFRSEEAKARVQRIEQELGGYKSATERVKELAFKEAGGPRSAELLAAVAQVMRHAQVIDDEMTALGDYKERNAAEASEATTQLYTRSLSIVVGTLAFGIAFAIGMGVLISRSITRPLGRAVEIAQTVAAGDLSSRIEVQGRDETAQLLGALKNMNDNLARIVAEVRQGSESISTGSAQIATGNADLSQRTEEQASNLEQTAASMEQLTATVRQNATSAREASDMAQSASQVAERGGEAVSQVVATMQDISESSRKISEIITLIDGIAFQTNILALNAAVEAARAGEQGRGFAVVAGEVRSLAQRSAEAAKQIKDLINASVERVQRGTQLVADAGRNVGEVVTQVRQVTTLITGITEASQQQSQGISQVGDAVTQLDQVTQQNASLVEESAAAAESLRQQADRLMKLVAQFRVADGMGRAAA
jgi:methyl-accepting chemotaxis protein